MGKMTNKQHLENLKYAMDLELRELEIQRRINRAVDVALVDTLSRKANFIEKILEESEESE
jgi:hypothetical protein